MVSGLGLCLWAGLLVVVLPWPRGAHIPPRALRPIASSTWSFFWHFHEYLPCERARGLGFRVNDCGKKSNDYGSGSRSKEWGSGLRV
jgi:hypothetical protein